MPTLTLTLLRQLQGAKAPFLANDYDKVENQSKET